MKDRLTHNIGLKIMSFLFAVFLWVMVINIDDPVSEEVFRNIPIEVLHEEIFTTKASTYSIVGEDTVAVTVRARRKLLSDIRSDDIRVTADIRNRVSNSISEATLPTEVTIQGFGMENIDAYTTPGNIQIEIEPSTQKDFPVSVETMGSVRNGYAMGRIVSNPRAIKFGGAESQINKIKRVVAKADISGLSTSTSINANLELYDANGIEIDAALFENNLGTEGLKVDVEVFETKEVPIVVEEDGIEAASGYTVGDITCTPQSVSVAGEEEVLDELSEIVIPKEAVRLKNLSASKEVSVDVAEYLPEGIVLEDATAGAVIITVPVEKNGTKMFSIPSNNIEMENVLASLRPSIDNVEKIEIQVTGSSAVLEQITETPRVYVDLGRYTMPGNITVPLQAELPKGCRMAGSVPIQITLEKQ